ncbi:MAG TPA: aquaporin [Puia sp.]
MRAVDIRIKKVSGGITQLTASFKKNWKFYMQEALGLAIFMVSACFFSGILFGQNGFLVSGLTAPFRQSLLGLMMGLTALYIFYSPLTSSSGSHINPAVTLAFFRIGKIGRWDALFYMIFQFIGGTLAVYLMAAWMGDNLTAAPLSYVVTVPGKYGDAAAAITEFIIAFFIMAMVLFTTDHPVLKKYSRIFAAILVCLYVIIAGPVSGFGMNPARSFASALPAHIWTAFWIYLIIPVAGMLGAAEFFLFVRRS